MPWFIYALIGAISQALFYFFDKRLLKKFGVFSLAAIIKIAPGIILIIISLSRGIPSLGPNLSFAIVMTAGLNVFAAILLFKALKQEDLSLAVPIISFTPLFLIATSWIILGEVPSDKGIIGIIFIVIGSYVLNIKGSLKNIFSPIKSILSNKAVLFMLGVAFLYSISSNFDKMVVLNSDTTFGHSLVYFLSGAILLITALAKKDKFIGPMKNGWKLLLGAMIFSALITIAMNNAYELTIVPYAISVKRTSVIFAALFGFFFLKEKNILPRLLGTVIMVIGVIIITLS